MSEIDFKEIEKAMAELVNKAQGKRREQQLGKVVKKRDEIAKKVETARGQGTVATKRIIIGNSRLRAPDAAVKSRVSNIPLNANRNPINDFRPRGEVSDLAPPPLPTKTYQEEVAKTNPDLSVGDLSDQYLQKQVTTPKSDQEELVVPEDSYSSDEIVVPEEEVAPATEENSPNEETELPQIAEQNEEIETQLSEEPADNLPESEELATSLQDPTYDYGAVHRIYGQRLPNKFARSNTNTQSNNIEGVTPFNKKQKDSNKRNVSKLKKKRGFLFYFVYFLFIASFLTWAAAAYLYFVY